MISLTIYIMNRIQRTMVPTDRVVRRGDFIQSSASSVDPATKTVKLTNGKEVKYDVLVIATGSRNFSPGDAPVSVTTKDGLSQYYNSIRDKIIKSKSVVIVGTGAVGLELASEIREFGQAGAKIALVSRASRILAEPGMKYREKGLRVLEDDLVKLKIDVILQDEVASHPLPADLAEAIPVVETPGGVTLKSGKKIDCDLLIFAVGSRVNTKFLPSQWLDPATGEVLVDQKTLQLLADPNIFAVGDIAKLPFAKRGYFAGEDGKVVAKNVVQVLHGKKPTNKIQRMNVIFINLGSNGGRGLLPIGTLGPKMTTMLKSKDLFVNQFWKAIAPNHDVPKATF
jgi:NADH dehydrogenase FAD-containing subunit